MSQIEVEAILGAADIRHRCREADGRFAELDFDGLRFETLDSNFDDDEGLRLVPVVLHLRVQHLGRRLLF